MAKFYEFDLRKLTLAVIILAVFGAKRMIRDESCVSIPNK